jgi:ketosteroid isomerase-like protein
MKHALPGLSLLLAQAAFAADPGLSAAECEVWERERSFAQSVDKHDKQAFAEHVHENAVFAAATDHTQRGRDTIVANWSGIIEGKVHLEWRPQFVSIGTDTNVAMSRGPYVFQGKDKDGNTRYGIGDFVSIWVRKDAQSPWYVVLDGGGPPPKDASAEEAGKHLANAPASCPRAQ